MLRTLLISSGRCRLREGQRVAEGFGEDSIPRYVGILSFILWSGGLLRRCGGGISDGRVLRNGREGRCNKGNTRVWRNYLWSTVS